MVHLDPDADSWARGKRSSAWAPSAPRPAPRGKADASNRERAPKEQPPKEQHLRSAVDHGKKKTIDDASWSSSGYHRPGQYPPHSVYRQPSLGSAPSSLG